MEASSSSSSPLSVHLMDLSRPLRSKTLAFSAKFKTSIDCHGRPRLLSIHPLLPFPSPSSFGFGISHKNLTTPRSFDPQSGHLQKRLAISAISAIFERFTERAIKAIMYSQREAKALGRDMVFTQHLLLGLIAEDRSPDGFLSSGITIQHARNAVRSIWAGEDGSPNDANSGAATSIPFSISSKRVFEAAVEYSRSMGYNYIAPEHIAVGLFTADDGSAARVLKRLGANINNLASAAVTRLQGELAKDGRVPSAVSDKIRDKSNSRKALVVRSSDKTKEKSILDQFCVDLSARARKGLIDPVIGRDIEIQRIIQILCRRTKNNPILLGDPGVGKTAIAEGLAINVANGDVPFFLWDKRILSLDIGLLIAGAKERGELESRVTSLMREILKEGNIILFIDEVHMLIGSGTVGSGGKGSGLDIANLLKPSLGRGDLQCVASTTMNEYRKHFEKDKALARRFQPVYINEPSQEDAIRILLGLREKYEAHHRCRFTVEAINAAVYLSARYIADRYLPDKAIDLIDEAGSRARMDAFKRRKERQLCILSKSPNEYWQEIRLFQAMHEVELANKMKGYQNQGSEDDRDAAGIGGDIKLIPKLPVPTELGDDESVVVGPDDIAAIASLWSGIPIQQLTADERMLMIGLDEQLRKRVIGQEDAVGSISRAVKRSCVGLKDPDKPIATLLFCGPTGVGKTELTKALAACYFGSEAAMLRLDMSEYVERHTVSKLIGSPPGYVGYGEGGTLTEAVRREPFAVILLDEIEKAHPDIFNILLQVFEDGHLTDSQGRRVSFKNTLIVMTSNVGSTSIPKGRRSSIGLSIAGDEDSNSYSGMKAIVMEELKAYFRPELLNRIDEVVVFRPLEKSQGSHFPHNIIGSVISKGIQFQGSEHGSANSLRRADSKMLEILSMMLQEVKGRLLSLGISFEVSEAIMDLVCQQCYDRSYGARPLRRAVTHLIEDVISEALLAGDYKPGDTAVIDVDSSGNPVVTHRSDHSIHLSDTTSTL